MEMESSKADYHNLEINDKRTPWVFSTGCKEPREWVYSATCTILLYLSVTVLAVFAYNPLAASLAFSFGGLLAFSGVLIMASVSKKEFSQFDLPNPWIATVFLAVFQVTASISYHYNPMNHGAVSTLLTMAFLPGVVFSKAHKGKYFPVLVAFAAYAFTVYRAAHVWLHMSVLYATIAIIALAALLRMPRNKRNIKDLSIVAIGNLVLNGFVVGGFCLLGIYPLDDEMTLIVYCSVSGVVAGVAVYLQISHAQNKITLIGYSLIGMAQVFSEALVFWFTLFGQLFLPVLPVFLGVVASLIISLWDKRGKNND